MNIEISEMDETGAVQVTVTGDESQGDVFKRASAVAAGAIRKHAKDNDLGKAERIAAAGTNSGATFTYRVRYRFGLPQAPALVVEHLVDTSDYMDGLNGVLADKAPENDQYDHTPWTAVIRDTDSRCQMQPVHRSLAVQAVALVVTKGGEYLRACQQCADHFKTVVYCQYNSAHNIRHVPALRFLDCRPKIGIVPACVECADVYTKQNGAEPA